MHVAHSRCSSATPSIVCIWLGLILPFARHASSRRWCTIRWRLPQLMGCAGLQSQWLELLVCVCNPHIQESPHPWAPKSLKSLKKDFPGLPARSVKKVSKKSPNTDFVVFLTLFWVIWDFFDTFLTLRAGRPGNPLLRLFGDFGPRGPPDSCIWRLQSQPLVWWPSNPKNLFGLLFENDLTREK